MAALSNSQIAEVFQEIASLLEIKGESVFKVRAYQRVAEAIAGLDRDLDQLRAQKDGLRSLPGVGASTAQKIEELLDTGKSTYHQGLLAEIPPSVLELLRIPGLGPKKAKLLMDEGITTVEQLEQAASAGRLRTLRGMGEKTERDILRGITHLREYEQRTDLGLAWEIAENIMAQLRASAPVEQMEAAGSLRRMRETIGDIDILVTSGAPEAVMEEFAALPLTAEVLARGSTKTTIRTTAGIQADIRVVPPESFGAALQYFTGSKQHNIVLRDYAERRGLKLNEYGVFRVKDGEETRIGGATEEEMYAAVGLPLIPAEIREDQGEIEAARKNQLPELVELSDIRGEMHCHTNWSDGHGSVEQMARAAKEAGHSYLALTDHSPSQTVAGGLKLDRLLKRRQEIEKARKAVQGITILEGAEVDILRGGELDYPDEVLSQLDYVVASVHSGWKMEREAMTRRIITAMDNPWVDCIGHPTGRLVGQREPFDVDIEAVLAAAAKLGVAMEISSDPARLDLRDVHARRARDLGVKLMIVTDAHWPGSFSLLRFGVATARRGWVEAGDVLNCLPLAQLRKRLRRAKAQTKR
ncbi:MAG: DNA polymerase/3'-5' exonuclease PolX [Armatimonadota bacterium]